jgi:hypothetical protein
LLSHAHPRRAQVLPADRPTADALLASFWAAYDGRALDPQGLPALRAFFVALLECAVLLANRLREPAVIVEQSERVWRELVGLGVMTTGRSEGVAKPVAGALLVAEIKRKGASATDLLERAAERDGIQMTRRRCCPGCVPYRSR